MIFVMPNFNGDLLVAHRLPSHSNHGLPHSERIRLGERLRRFPLRTDNLPSSIAAATRSSSELKHPNILDYFSIRDMAPE